MLAALLVAGLVVVVVVSGRNQDAPLVAVREYVEAIARGDAGAANAAVDPRAFSPGVDPALLTDAVLGSATERIVLDDVELDLGADLDSDVVAVRVTYTLAKRPSTIVLHARRAGTTAGVLDRWQVIDPLLVPVRVATNEAALRGGTLGPAPIPVTGPGRPEQRFFVYPAVYELRGAESRYVRAELVEVVANRPEYGEPPKDTDEQVVRAALTYRATPELVSVATTRMTEHLTACLATSPRVPPGCPFELYGRAEEGGANLRLVQQPVASVEYVHKGDPSNPFLALHARDGRVAYTERGRERTATFLVHGRVVVTAEDDVTVTFTPSL